VGVRRGVTLIELMVVVSIMLMVTVIAVPAMKPALENRKIREAARSVNVYLGSARNHAIELGRPVGVLFTRDTTQANPCLTLQQVEIPAPYAGDTSNSVAQVSYGGIITTSTGVFNPDGSNEYAVQISFPSPLSSPVYPGDYIQFNCQGPLYMILQVKCVNGNPPSAPPLTSPISSAIAATAVVMPPSGWSVTSSMPSPLPWPAASGTPSTVYTSVPFQIIRQPDLNGNVTLAMQSAVAPLQLPTGTAIDMLCSGTNSGSYAGFGPGNANPGMLIFSPTGSVYSVFANFGPSALIEPIYFLIGRRDRVFNVKLGSNVTIPQVSAVSGDVLPADGLANWQDTNNLWVTVTPQTGRITTVENTAINTVNTTKLLSTTNADAIVLARGFALQGQSKGGR
jgi:prepilin-type N-terminal cleavage/methylation domain-containing protein